jgi:hypothetical protein
LWIVVTLHYKGLAKQVLCLPKLNTLSRQFELHPSETLDGTYPEMFQKSEHTLEVAL